MLTRAFVGLLKGAVLGSLLAAALLFGLGLRAVPLVSGYALAALVGVLTGLVAGKPIWLEGARIEAGLKSAFGGLLGAGLLYAADRFVHVPAGLVPRGTLAGPVSVAVLPMIAMVLGSFFELDNTPAPEPPAKAATPRTPAVRLAASSSRVRVDQDAAAVAGEEEVPASGPRRSTKQ